ncbi:MAG: F0F1 ATP synthase subunit epsilon [Clostridiales bacterium]|nr:F0F1 ATP synthase subunit epsilon [Clostridiales bacterium]
MDKIKLVVLSPEGKKLEETASSVTLKSSDGWFGVREGSLPIKALLSEGDIRYVKSGKDNSFFISGGIAEVRNDTVTVLVE